MSDQDWKPGDTLNIAVTEINPYKETRYSQAFEGGGYGVDPRKNFQMTPNVAAHSLSVRINMEKDHQENIKNLPEQTLSELSTNGVQSAETATQSDSNSIKRDLLIIDKLIQLKNEYLQDSLQKANSFYGSDPHNKTEKEYINRFNRYTRQLHGPGETNKLWIRSYLAGYSVKYHNESIRLLMQYSNQLTAAYTDALTREEAARQAEALAREIAERNAENVNLATVSGAAANAKPLVITPDGMIEGYDALPTSLRGAVESLEKATAAIGRGPLAALFASVFYSPTLGNGDLQRNPVVLTMPLSQLAGSGADYTGLHTSESVSLPFRITSTTRGEHTQLYLSPTGEALSDKVRVREAKLDPLTHLYTFRTEGFNPRTLTWTPGSAPGKEVLGSTELPAEQPDIKIYPGARVTPVEGRTDEYPAEDEADTDDYILWFPKESGIDPVYVMASRSGPRYEPGTATGPGQVVGANWLGSAAEQSTAPIPEQIADQLRGLDFRDFKEFREKFWESVSSDPALAKQFSKSNLRQMRRGSAPFTIPTEHVGGRNKFEIHHVRSISDGGAVYDMENLRITTPKNHIEIHKKGNE